MARNDDGRTYVVDTNDELTALVELARMPASEDFDWGSQCGRGDRR